MLVLFAILALALATSTQPAGPVAAAAVAAATDVPRTAPATPTPSRRIPDNENTNDNVTIDPGNIPQVAPTPTSIVVIPCCLELAPAWDFRAARIDVYQSVHARFGTADTDIPLIAGKETMVRVYVELTGVDVPKPAMVSLNAYRNGEYAGNCNSWLFDPQMDVGPGSLFNPFLAVLVRDDLSRTFNFTYPLNCSVQDEGDVTYKATIQGKECQACGGNNEIETTVNFMKMRSLILKPYLVTYNTQGSPNMGKVPNWSSSGLDYLYSLYPINSITVKPAGSFATTIDLDWYSGHDPTTPQDDTTTTDEDARKAWWDDYWNFLVYFHDHYGSASSDINVALLDPSIPGCYGISGFSFAASGFGCGGTYAHEFGHSFGLPHASDFHGECAGGSCDPNWIYPHGGIMNHGWNALQPSKLVLPDGVDGNGDPWHSHDTMSYGGCTKGSPKYNTANAPWYCGKWLSPKNYGWIAQRLICAQPQQATGSQAWKNCFNNQAPFANLANDSQRSILADAGEAAGSIFREASNLLGLSSAGAPAAQTDMRAYLLVSGELDDEGHAMLKPMYGMAMPAGSHDESGEGPYRIELLGADGRVLFTRNFEPFPIQAHTEMHRAFIDEYLPADPDTAVVRLWRGDALLAERMVSRSAPRVEVVTPNGGEMLDPKGEVMVEWKAQDADGDPLFFWLQYSPDGGENWETIEKNLTDTQYPLDLAQLPGSDSMLVKVIASDGVNTADDTSDRPFMVGKKDPMAEITAMAGQSAFPESAQGEHDMPAAPTELHPVVQAGQPIVLEGTALDLEDGMLGGEHLVWTSNLDGVLGSGERVTVLHLSEGDHVITLTATDADGQQGMATKGITVVPAPG